MWGEYKLSYLYYFKEINNAFLFICWKFKNELKEPRGYSAQELNLLGHWNKGVVVACT